MLPSDKQDRKERPMFSGLFRYFPDALAEVAHVSYVGNIQHNGPDAPLHWDRSKSQDHADCIARHLADSGTMDSDGLRHTAKVAWRALAMLQLELEAPGQCLNCPEKIGLEGCCREPKVAERISPGACVHTRFYVAGPMRNYPDLNFPAFDAAKAELNGMGIFVISPADMDRTDPQPRDTEGLPQHVYAARDTDALIELAKNNPNGTNGVYMLRSWQASKGASAEHQLAQWLGLRIVYQPE